MAVRARRWVDGRTIACVAISALGISGAVARFTGARIVSQAGALFLFSPQPVVFHDENISANLTLLFDTPGKPQEPVVLSREMISGVAGPLHRRDVYIHALLGSATLPRPLWEQALSFGLCGDGPIAREVGLPTDPPRITLVLSYDSLPSSSTRVLELACGSDPE